MTAPRPESGGQQQAAAEVCFELDGARVHGDPNMPTGTRDALSQVIAAAKRQMEDDRAEVKRRHRIRAHDLAVPLGIHEQSTACEVLAQALADVERQGERRALAEAARPGQELRARVEALAGKYGEVIKDGPCAGQCALVGGGMVAYELLAALEDPR